MNARHLLSQLSYGEFNNTSVGNEGSGTINKSHMGRVLTFINDGLMDIATKFKLSEKAVHIQLYDHITDYHLLSRFAVSQQPQPDVPFPYILDSNRTPFKGDVLKVYAVWDNYDRERTLNDEADLKSVFTLRPNVLTVPYPEDNITLFVHYIAKPQMVTVDNLDEELDIPDFLVPALRSYVASRVFMTMGSADNMRLGQEFQIQYITALNNLKQADAMSESRFTQNSFERRGWI